MQLNKKLSLYFIAIILISISLITIIASININNKFDNFLVVEQKNRLELIYKDLQEIFLSGNIDLFENKINSYSTMENINITILDKNNSLLFSSNNATSHGHGHMKMKNRHGMMDTRDDDGHYVENAYKLNKGDEKYTLLLGYLDNSHINDNAIFFKNTLRQSLLISGLISILISIILSQSLSSNITKPISKINKHSNTISQGNYSKPVEINSNIKEIKELSNSINALQNKLLSQEDDRKKYASNISHELRTPITTIKTYLEAISDGVWDLDKPKLETLNKEILALSKLVDNLNDSFTSSGDLNLFIKEEVNISNYLNKIIYKFKPIFLDKNISLKTNIAEDFYLEIDKSKFEAIINNLISNSIKYRDPKKSVNNIYIYLRKDKENLLIGIVDNGIGISGDSKKVFERFYRAENVKARKLKGSGLGLSIVKSNMAIHQAHINLVSKVNVGSHICLIFPLKIKKDKS